jgi:hypothetical protein
MTWQGKHDRVEATIELGLEAAGIRYRRADDNPRHLDFYLPDLDIYIEVKRFHTPRTAEQMERVPDIIVVQGLKAAVAFVKMIGGYQKSVAKENRRLHYADILAWNCPERDNECFNAIRVAVNAQIEACAQAKLSSDKVREQRKRMEVDSFNLSKEDLRKLRDFLENEGEK